MVRLEQTLASWKTIREDTAQAVEDFSAQDLDFKPADGMMSFGELARHILEAGHLMTGMLLDEVKSMAGPDFREMVKKYVSQVPPTEGTGALARELRSSV